MSCFVTFLVVLSLLIVACGPLVRLGGRVRGRRRAYQQVAGRFHGQFRRGGLLHSASVVFRHGPARVVLREGGGRGPYPGRCTQLQIDWPDKRLSCDIFPRADAQRVKATWRLRPQDSGDPAWDAELVIRGRSAAAVRELLSDGVRWQIHRLRCLDERRRIYLFLGRGQLLVQAPAALNRWEDLEPLVTAALDLYDQLLLTQAEGIEFVEGDATAPLGDVVCQVCGDAIQIDLVYCRRCKTPHHGDCWEYTGVCSIFGCRETNFLRPQPGVSTASPNHVSASHNHLSAGGR